MSGRVFWRAPMSRPDAPHPQELPKPESALESLLPLIEQEIANSTVEPEPATEQPQTLSEQIQQDQELMAVLDRRPELCAEFVRRAEAIDTLAGRVKAYLTATMEGFDQMYEGLLLLEVPKDPATGEPMRTSDGSYVFSRLDELQRTVLDRFLSYQRFWHLWPRLVHRVNSAENLTEEERRLRLSAVNLVRAMLFEHDLATSAAC